MFIYEIRKIPFFRLIIPFIFGIFFQIHSGIPTFYCVFISSVFFVVSIVYIYLYNKNPNYHTRWISGILIYATFFFFGALIVSIQHSKATIFLEAENYIGVISEPIQSKAKTVKTTLILKSYQTDSGWQSSESKILIYIQKDSAAQLLEYGDRLLFKSNLHEIKNQGNPDEFDYKTYLSNKNIYYQSYIKHGNWKVIAKNKGNLIFSIAFYLRNKLLKIYQSKNIVGNEFAVLSALTLGIKDYLSPKLINTYSNSGAMHILAVSGLHVGIIYLILNYLLIFFKRNRILNILRAVIILITIWFFALITGLAPSVTRATIMLSFIILGNVSNRKPSIYNSIAISAFLILLFQPFAINNVGFQLSYMAVLAIVYFYPRIYRLLQFNNTILDKLWALTVVSVAAQIGTAPISIFYFHKFPVWFFISNFVAIPAAYIIIVLAVLLLIFNPFPLISNFIAFLLNKTLIFLNISTLFIEKLPFSTLRQISFTPLETFSLYILIIALAVSFAYKNKRWFILSLFILLIFLYSFNYRKFNSLYQKEFIVFNSKQNSALAFVNKNRFVLLVDSNLIKNGKDIKFLTNQFIAEHFIDNFQINTIFDLINSKSNLYKYRNYFLFENQKLLLLNNNSFKNKISVHPLNIDYIILSKGFTGRVEDIIKLFNFQQIIIDSSVPLWQKKKILQDCINLNIKYQDVKKDGAFIKTL